MPPQIIPNAAQRKVKWRCLLQVTVLTGSAAWFWAEYKYCFIPKRFGTVKEGRIYRSGQLSAPLIKGVLRKHGIRVIVDLTAENANNPYQLAESNAAKELSIQRMKFPLRGDGTGNVEQYANALAAICQAEQEGKPVLVHCGAGAQRTGGVIAVYRLLIERQPMDAVVEEMASYDWDPIDDVALPIYLNENMPRLAQMLVDRGVLCTMPDRLPIFEDYRR